MPDIPEHFRRCSPISQPERRRLPAIALAGLLTASTTGCGGLESDSTFSQRPGFAEWYTCDPPSDTVPDAGEQELLRRFRPRFFLPSDGEGPIDFYRDYVAEGQLTDGQGAVISDTVDRELLNSFRDRPDVTFSHRPSGNPPRMAVYGRIEKAAVPFDDAPWTFLSYTLVFRHSGLPAGLSAPAAFFLDLAGLLRDWHQLDHYTAVTLALDRQQRPVAATFQQHNYLRTYILAESDGDGRLRLPPDGRIRIDAAIWSNEFYPHRPGRTRHRATSFMDEYGAAWLILGETKPSLTADDVTDPAREIDPPLRFLPPSDAFYTFHGRLGEYRRLPGADGPPGADFNTLPAFKPLAVQMIAFHWWEGDRLYLDILRQNPPSAVQPGEFGFLGPLVRRFAKMLAEACAECGGGRDRVLRMASQAGLVGSGNATEKENAKKWMGC